jgi:hypothetical protein
MSKPKIGPADLLLKAGFSSEESVPGMFYNDYVCFNINYQREGITDVTNNDGDIVECLPTNSYAFLGFLIKKRFVSFQFVDDVSI